MTDIDEIIRVGRDLQRDFSEGLRSDGRSFQFFIKTWPTLVIEIEHLREQLRIQKEPHNG